MNGGLPSRPHRPCTIRCRRTQAILSVVLGLVAAECRAAEVSAELPGAAAHVYKTVGDVSLRLFVYTPADHKPADRRPAIVIFFGGGWVRGEPAQFARHAAHFAARGMVAVLPEYRTQSRHGTDPLACVADGKSALRWVRTHAAELGIDPDRIAASGGSAGGHVAASTTLITGLDEACEDTRTPCQANALVLFNPVIDTTQTGYGAKKLGTRAREASPMHHVRPGLPPTVIFHGKADKTVRYENVERFAAEMQKAGNTCQLFGYDGQDHGFYRKQETFYAAVISQVDRFLEGLGWISNQPNTGPWNMTELKKAPAATWGNREGLVQEVYYQGEPWEGKPTRVFAYVGRPAQGQGPWPAMVLIHGGHGKAFAEWAERWAKLGYVALSMDLYGCGPESGDGPGQRKKLPDGGPDWGNPTIFTQIKQDQAQGNWVYHAVAAVVRAHSLLAALPEVDRDRIGVTGISWGGFLTCIAAGIDDRVKLAVPVHGCGFIHEDSAWVKVFANLGPEWTARWVAQFDPSRYLPQVRCPILFVNGTNDGAYPLDSYQKSYQAVVGPRQLTIRVRMPHGHEPGWSHPEIPLFVESVVRDGVPLPQIESAKVAGDSISAAFVAKSPVVVGQLHYTHDQGPWNKRQWESIDAQVRGGQVKAVLPDRRPVVCYLSVTDERGALVATPHVELPAEQDTAPRLEQTDLFEVGQEDYLSYRIPAIAVTARGTVLAFTGARRKVSDWAETVLLMRRSTDGGRSWEPRRVVASQAGHTVDCPVPIVDHKKQRLHFLYMSDYARCWYTQSPDEGQRFSKPRDITAVFEAFRPEYDWTVMTPAPGTAIQLSTGRLVVPVWLSNGGGHAHRPSCTAVIYSDDHGATWQRGAIAVQHSEQTPNPSEAVVVELSDGRVMLNVRCESPRYRRLVTISPDGATNWSPPQFDEALYDPICHASLIRVPQPNGQVALLWANPDSHDQTEALRKWGGRPRQNVTLRLSRDDGRTWPVSRVLEPGRSAYTSLACAPDGTLYCLYERGFAADNELNTRWLTVARFNLAWLTGESGKPRAESGATNANR